eukprot:TRINITY_DN60270_c0_g1_i1.p1 TRINITY_DN60270_c0_g1~~TRINITY_DN60270_c0_g1_i1.p1  ORF type:complete len:109 (-),score=9.12 TRINITY_DN60270_c0_g1_i1:16-342(-)
MRERVIACMVAHVGPNEVMPGIVRVQERRCERVGGVSHRGIGLVCFIRNLVLILKASRTAAARQRALSMSQLSDSSLVQSHMFAVPDAIRCILRFANGFTTTATMNYC